MNSPKIIVAPCGTLLRAAHIVSVSSLFESPEMGTDVFAVYTVGNNEPYLFAAPLLGAGPKAAARRKADTAILHLRFIDEWVAALDGQSAYFKN